MAIQTETTQPTTAFDHAIEFLQNITDVLPKTPEDIGSIFYIESYTIPNSLQYLKFECFCLRTWKEKVYITITAGGGHSYEFLINNEGKIKPLENALMVVGMGQNPDWLDPKDLVQKWIDAKRAPKVGMLVGAMFYPNLWAQEHVRKWLKKIDKQLPYQLNYDAKDIGLYEQLSKQTNVRLLSAFFYCETNKKTWGFVIQTNKWFDVDITDAGWLIPDCWMLWEIFGINNEEEKKAYSPEKFLAIWKKSRRARRTYEVFEHIFNK